MDRFALTDRNALYGFVFYRQICAEAGLTPIAGAEVVEAVEAPAVATQLSLWDGAGDDPAGRLRSSREADTHAMLSAEARARTSARRDASPAHSRAERYAAEERVSALERAERCVALEAALDRVRTRFGTSALVPAAWMAHGLVLRPPARS